MHTSDPMPVALLQLNPPSLPMPIPLRRSPWLRKGQVDTLAKRGNKDEILRYLVDVAMELRNHEGATHAHRTRIEKELLDVVNLAQNLQVTYCIWTPLVSITVQRDLTWSQYKISDLHLTCEV
jgi:hypothetical protein